MKQCSKCGETKPISEYHRDKYANDGYVQKCKSCVKIKSKLWNQKNTEIVKIKNREKYLKNPEYYIQKSQKWIERNKQQKKITDKQYQLNNPEIYRLSKQRYKARKLKNGVYEISKKEWAKIYASPCIYCGSKINIQADHVVPVARGGTHGIGNLVAACQPCNGSKRERTITEWKKAKRKAAGNLQPATLRS